MEQVRIRLLVLFCSVIFGAVLILMIFETGLAPKGVMHDMEQANFIASSVMVLSTLAAIFTALRLFKFNKVREELLNNPVAGLSKWGVVRIAMLEAPLIINLLCAGLFDDVSYRYLALITLISMAFVYPTMNRCQYETEETTPKP